MILIATGLKREARILAGPGVRVIAGGGDPARLERELEAAADTASAILSMGLCGALAEGLGPGDWVVASEVLAPGRTFLPVGKWAQALAQRLSARLGPVLASDAMIADAAGKRAAHQASGAVAVDMESHVAGAVAARRGLPFGVARVVSDAADRTLPKAARAGMAADGSMDVWAVVRGLAADPRQLPDLIRLGREAEAAFKALEQFPVLLNPELLSTLCD